MKELVEYMIKSLVDKPEEAKVTQTDSENISLIEVRVAPEDTGKVIGKEGRIANALRTIAKSAGAKSRKRISVEIITEEKGR